MSTDQSSGHAPGGSARQPAGPSARGLLMSTSVVSGMTLLSEVSWSGPVFELSALSGAGTEELGYAVMRELEDEDEGD